MKKRGIILVTTIVILAVILLLTGIYFSSLMSEKRSSDTEKFLLQALNLAEAGANRGLAELRKRISDLEFNIDNNSIRSRNQVDFEPLAFLRAFGDFAGSGNEPIAFTLTGNEQDLNAGFHGNYSAEVTIISTQDPEETFDPDKYVYYYSYKIVSEGASDAQVARINKNVALYGNFTVTVTRPNFSRFALFTFHHRTPSDTTVWFTNSTNFTGPVHTNERFSFANNPSAHFTDDATQHEKKARFYNHGSPRLLDADSNPTCCEKTECIDTPCLDKPQFDKPFQRGQETIALPSSISQEELKKEAIGKDSGGNPLPEPGQNGIYLNYITNPDSSKELTGGIYIRGDSTVNMGLDANNLPVYTITRGTNTKKITVDYANNQTIVTNEAGSGGTPAGTYIGKPDGIKDEGTLIYAKDDIDSFSGTVQKDTQVSVSSERDIVITNHIMYQEYHPATETTPLNAEGYNNLLGILSWGGDIRIDTSAPNDINIHGVTMAPHGVFKVDDYDNQRRGTRGTATLLGGMITDFYGAFGTFSGSTSLSGYGRNFVYDKRMLGGYNPPYFPYVEFFDCSSTGLSNIRPSWQDKGV